MITGYELIEKMYSENYDEYEDTRLYSTGDSDLDELLERAFCEGYEYAQKQYSGEAETKVILDWLKGNTIGDTRRKERYVNKKIGKLNRQRQRYSGPGYPGIKGDDNGEIGQAYDEAGFINNLGKAAMIATPIAALTAGGIALHRHNKKKKEEKNKKENKKD